jgi:prepilin-type N-terminal cleavage/methylation domain-containing protein
MKNRKAFTLIEVLISIALLGMMIVPLFSVVDLMRTSNEKLLHALEKSKQVSKASKTLYMDILSSDGELSIKKDEFTRLCMEETKNSLYNLPIAKVCWLVLKQKNTLVRIEGNAYKLPLKAEDRVEADSVMTGLELFDVYQEKDKVIVLIKQKGQEPISFMLQGITNPVLEVLADGTKLMRDGRKVLPNGTQIFKDGSKILADGTIVPAPKGKGNKNPGDRGTSTPPKPETNTDGGTKPNPKPTENTIP